MIFFLQETKNIGLGILYFVLIDKEGRVRSGIDKAGNVLGVYDGTNDAQMKDLVNDVKVLMAEYKRPKRTKKKW